MKKRYIVSGFFFVLLIAWFCYSAAFDADFQLDDQSNLGGLASVSDTRGAVDFIVSGSAGPTGRPLSLLSFALQAGAWDDGAAAFLRVNTAIHILNAMLLAWCVLQIFRLRGERENRAVLLACTVAAFWVLLPLNATATVLVVQRMTSLSALCTLVGLAGYLSARATLAAVPVRALVLMSTSLAAASVIGALAKESALLLPMLVLVVEATLLPRPQAIDAARWRGFTAAFLWLPSLLVLGYVLSRWNYPDYVIARREFDAVERLLTEAQLLWLYLSKALVGAPDRLGIYQSDIAVVRSLFEPLSLLAVAGWIAAAGGALAWRRRFPLFAFAVLWFLAAHVVESTVIPLELYFEHRNYLAIIGPLIALCAFLFGHSALTRKVAAVVLPVMLLVNTFFLFSFTSLWGESSLAARHWAARYPDSVRAVTNVAAYQLSEESAARGVETISKFSRDFPRHAYLGIQALNLRCLTHATQTIEKDVDELERMLPNVTFTYTAGNMLSQLFTTSTKRACTDLQPQTVIRLAEALGINPRYRDDPSYNQFHHKLLAGIQRTLGDHGASLEHLQQAMEWRPSAELNMMMTMTLAETGDYQAAREFLAAASENTPRHPIKAIGWRRGLAELLDYVNALEEYSGNNRPANPGVDDAPGQP